MGRIHTDDLTWVCMAYAFANMSTQLWTHHHSRPPGQGREHWDMAFMLGVCTEGLGREAGWCGVPGMMWSGMGFLVGVVACMHE